MRILHIITRLILGGAQQNTVASCAAQIAAGHAVWLAHGPIYGPEGSLADEARTAGAQLVEVAPMRRAVLPLHDARTYFALRRLVREVRPDVVHTHSSKAGIVARAAAWAERVPAVIHTIHGLPFHDRQPAAVRGAYVAAERWAARRCHKLLGITRAMIDAFRRHGIGTPEQFEVVPSGVDPADFERGGAGRDEVRRQLGIPADAPVVGLVARLDRLKGQDDLLDAFPRICARYPGARLLLVGDGWERTRLEDRVRREGWTGRVLFTGLVPPPRVAELLRAMDVNTLPSYQEGQARTLVQALLAGCAIVGYAAGGIPEVCLDGRTGRLAPVGDRAALADAILALLDDPGERRRLTENGRAHAREHFSSRVMTDRLEAIYRATVQANRPAEYRRPE